MGWKPLSSQVPVASLLKGLTILDEGHIAPADMMGSWAGAMGQSQFMPSSFLNFAVDFNGDNRRDIWTTQADVFASAANYLARSGWRDDQTWGREVMDPLTTHLFPILSTQSRIRSGPL